uniref:ABC transporter substrate-binding protein n=1 Tax=Angelakisella sp. TaxID=1935177 RepID=UPI0040266A3C
MKKFLALLLAVVMVLTMVACGEGKKKADGQVVIGTSTEASGDWAYSAFVRNPNATDNSVVKLTDDMNTIDTDQHGDYVINKTVVKSYERIEEENGNVTFKFVINDGLKFNNGEAVTAENFVAWTMFLVSPAGKEMGVVSAIYNMLPGGLAYRNGETNILSAVRLYDEKTFSITIAKTGEDGVTNYLPFYYDLTYASMQAVNLTYWFGEGWSVKDDGEGVYFVNADGKEFTAETVGETVTAGRFATGNRVTAGPYNLVSFDQSSREIVLEVNENYNGNFEGQKPGIQKLVIVKTSDDTVMDMISTGQIQIYSQIADGAQVNAVLDLIEAGTIDSSPSQYDRAGYGYFGFACDLGPAQFTEFRQAVAYLLNRVEFAQTFCQGWGSVVHGPYCTAFSMTSKTDIDKKVNHYDYNPEKAVELLKQAGFVYNADGSDYVDGSGEVRYAKVTEEQAKYYESFNKVLADGTILMPATLNWASSEGNSVSALLTTMLASSDATKAAGVSIVKTEMTFPSLLSYMYRQEMNGAVGDFSVPTYNMFNLATGYNGGVYDESYNWTTDPEYIEQGYNVQHLYDKELDKLSMDMVYGVEPGDEATYLSLWEKYIIRWNELLPMVPLYSNIYVTVYPNTIDNYAEDSFWGFERAILYANWVGTK